MDETNFNNYTSIDPRTKDSNNYLKIECGRNEDVSNLNSGTGKGGNSILNKSTAYKLVFAIVASIIFAGCGNFVYLFAAGTREVKYVIPDGYILIPKQGKDHTPTTEADLTKEKESLNTTQETLSVTQTMTTTEPIKTSEPVSGCEVGWLEFDSSCYFFSEDAKAWQNAFNTCIELGGYLAEVTSPKENDALVLKARALGDEEGTWVWASSQTVSTYFNWDPLEPNNAPDSGEGEDCCELRSALNCLWNDEDPRTKDSNNYLTIECGRNEDVSNLNSGTGKGGNIYLNKSTAYKLVFAIVASIIFAGCGNFVYLFAAGTREVKYVIPDGYILIPKQGKDHTPTTETNLTKEKESLNTSQETFSVTQTTITTEPVKKSAPGCEAGWMEFGSSCYFFSRDAKTWQNAFNTCIELGGYLAEVTSPGENDALVLKARALGGNRWIGMTDQDEEGIWMWASSKTVSTYFNWYPSEPSNEIKNGIDEDCCEIRSQQNFFWNDEGCYVFTKYICEKQFD